MPVSAPHTRNPQPATRNSAGAVEVRRLRQAAWLSVAAGTALWVARWASFPLSLDPYYHLFVAEQVRAAGGPIAYEWWAYAPVGRAHLYPPLLHLLLAFVRSVGLPGLTVLRLASALIVPAVHVNLYLASRRLFGERIALGCVWAALVPFSFSAHAAITMAASLGLIELLWLLVALREGRTLASGVLFGLLWYTHLGMPWVALVTAAAWAAMERKVRRPVSGLLLGLAAGLPWLIHLAGHRSFVRVVPRQENEALELSVAVFVLAAIGLSFVIWQIWQKRARDPSGRPVVAMLLGFSLLAWRFSFRWLSGEGLAPLIVLSGFGLCASGEWAARGRSWRWQLGGMALATALAVCCPTITVAPAGVRWVWRDAAPFHLLGAATRELPFDVSLSSGGHGERVARAVAQMTQPGDILWSNAPYALGMVAALAQRPMSSAMFYEVGPREPFDPIRAARMIVWFRLPEGPEVPAREAVIRRYGLVPEGEDPVAELWRNPNAAATARRPEAALSMAGAGMLLCLALFGLVWGFRGRVDHEERIASVNG